MNYRKNFDQDSIMRQWITLWDLEAAFHAKVRARAEVAGMIAYHSEILSMEELTYASNDKMQDYRRVTINELKLDHHQLSREITQLQTLITTVKKN